jgi:hypothetical protein
VSEPSNATSPTDPEKPEPKKKRVAVPMAARKCRNYVRTEASNRWNVIVGNLLDKAEEASVPHITLVVKLAGFEQGPMPREPKRRTKSLARQLREEMEALEARNIAEFGE